MSPKLLVDSGAFSVKSSGSSLTAADYLSFAKKSKSIGAEFIAFDVLPSRSVGVSEAVESSRQNALALRDAGVPCIPVFHYGSPMRALERLGADGFQRVALGGAVGLSKKLKMAWLRSVFAEKFDLRFHGLGISGEEPIFRHPWRSVDHSSWMVYGSNGQALIEATPGKRLLVDFLKDRFGENVQRRIDSYVARCSEVCGEKLDPQRFPDRHVLNVLATKRLAMESGVRIYLVHALHRSAQIRAFRLARYPRVLISFAQLHPRRSPVAELQRLYDSLHQP